MYRVRREVLGGNFAPNVDYSSTVKNLRKCSQKMYKILPPCTVLCTKYSLLLHVLQVLSCRLTAWSDQLTDKIVPGPLFPPPPLPATSPVHLAQRAQLSNRYVPWLPVWRQAACFSGLPCSHIL